MTEAFPRGEAALSHMTTLPPWALSWNPAQSPASVVVWIEQAIHRDRARKQIETGRRPNKNEYHAEHHGPLLEAEARSSQLQENQVIILSEKRLCDKSMLAVGEEGLEFCGTF